ncbi:MAG TPA: cytochrome c [Lacunisphaera sp.]|jgi:mono/diheme cytochrome c family protein|nr:cytochrome c [Lacunisphaera sp.]
MKTPLLLTALLSLGVVTTSFAADAKANWEEHCAKCHGADGKGDTKMGKKLHIRDLTDAKVQAAFTDEEGVKAIKEGRKDDSGKTLMKANDEVSVDEAKALVQFVRTLKS